MVSPNAADFGLDFVTANRFYVEMESCITASFTECQGLGFQVKHESYFEGGVNDQQRIILGRVEFSEVTLKRGLSNDLVFWDWVSQVLKQRQANNALHHRRNVNILVFNQAGETMQCWTLIGAVPVGWKAPALTADSTSVAIEELTLAYEGLKVVAYVYKVDENGQVIERQAIDKPPETIGNYVKGASALTSGRDQSGYFSSN